MSCHQAKLNAQIPISNNNKSKDSLNINNINYKGPIASATLLLHTSKVNNTNNHHNTTKKNFSRSVTNLKQIGLESSSNISNTYHSSFVTKEHYQSHYQGSFHNNKHNLKSGTNHTKSTNALNIHVQDKTRSSSHYNLHDSNSNSNFKGLTPLNIDLCAINSIKNCKNKQIRGGTISGTNAVGDTPVQEQNRKNLAFKHFSNSQNKTERLLDEAVKAKNCAITSSKGQHPGWQLSNLQGKFVNVQQSSCSPQISKSSHSSSTACKISNSNLSRHSTSTHNISDSNSVQSPVLYIRKNPNICISNNNSVQTSQHHYRKNRENKHSFHNLTKSSELSKSSSHLDKLSDQNCLASFSDTEGPGTNVTKFGSNSNLDKLEQIAQRWQKPQSSKPGHSSNKFGDRNAHKLLFSQNLTQKANKQQEPVGRKQRKEETNNIEIINTERDEKASDQATKKEKNLTRQLTNYLSADETSTSSSLQDKDTHAGYEQQQKVISTYTKNIKHKASEQSKKSNQYRVKSPVDEMFFKKQKKKILADGQGHENLSSGSIRINHTNLSRSSSKNKEQYASNSTLQNLATSGSSEMQPHDSFSLSSTPRKNEEERSERTSSHSKSHKSSSLSMNKLLYGSNTSLISNMKQKANSRLNSVKFSNFSAYKTRSRSKECEDSSTSQISGQFNSLGRAHSRANNRKSDIREDTRICKKNKPKSRTLPEHFAIDENGQFYWCGFLR